MSETRVSRAVPSRNIFAAGQRVYDKRDGATGTIIQMRSHSNGSPKWLVQFDKEQMRVWVWQVDLRHADNG